MSRRRQFAPLFLMIISLFVPFWASAEEVDAELPAGWLRLMHYRPEGLQFASAITSSPFFITATGEREPRAELQAQLATLQLESDFPAKEELSFACRFPARARWLRENLAPATRPALCRELNAWKRKLQFRSLSLIYASAYAGNSASMFGHNLLKINLQEATRLGASGEGQELLDYGVAFLAQSDPSDGLSYAFKGLAGGYPGFFTLQPYYELVNTYNYAENRDLWELEIPLQPMEKELFLEHLWELLHFASTPYYFTHVNCSSMLLALLDVIKPDWNLTVSPQLFVLPAVVMQRSAQHLPAALMHFRPSERRLFRQQLEDLSQGQRQELQALWQGELAPGEVTDSALLDLSLKRVNLSKSRLALAEQGPLRQLEGSILLARSRLPMASLEGSARQAGNNPVQAHPGRKAGVYASVAADSLAMGLHWRYGLHDILDPMLGFEPYYQLNYFDLKLDAAAKPHFAATLAEVWSLSPFYVEDPLPSWILRGGSRTQARGEAVETYINGAAGFAWELRRDRSLLAFLPDASFGIEHLASSPLFLELGAQLLWLQRWSDRWQSLFTAHPAWRHGRERRRQDFYGFELRRSWGRDQQLGVELSHQERPTLQLGWSRFY